MVQEAIGLRISYNVKACQERKNFFLEVCVWKPGKYVTAQKDQLKDCSQGLQGVARGVGLQPKTLADRLLSRSQKITVHKFFEENTQEHKNKGTRHDFHLGALLGRTDYMQMCAPAR
eukprot:491243-Pelagomonas_calceolata.AAC.9